MKLYAQTRPVTHTLVIVALCTTSALAQNRYNSFSRYEGPVQYDSRNYNAVDAMAARLSGMADFTRARGDVMRAQGEATVNQAVARDIRVDTKKKELWLPFERSRAMWTQRYLGETERAKRRYDALKTWKRGNKRTWDRIRNHPDAGASGIANANDLNWLAERLSSSALAHDYSQDRYVSSGSYDMTIPAEVLHGLQLTRKHGRHLVFRADSGQPLQIDFWPWLLRGTDFHSYRERFVSARDTVMLEAAEGQISYASLVALQDSLETMQRKLERDDYRERYLHISPQEFPKYSAAAAFLRSLRNEIRRLQETGHSRAFGGAYAFDGASNDGDLISFLKFMNRNGLKFARVQPGDEAAYYHMHSMMKDLYTNIAENDDGIRDDPEYRKLTPPEVEAPVL